MATERHGIATHDEPTVGERIGRYLVLETVGEGGMGVVLRAYDPDLDRVVAVKLLRDGGRADASVEVRLLREGQAMARLAHPNVLPVFDVGIARSHGSPVLFIAMEYVEGDTLRRWAAQPRSREEVLRTFAAAGRGLAAAHAAGIVHRDFKPDNVLIGHDGRVRVMDFGIARAGDPSSSSEGRATPSDLPVLDDALTCAGDVLGTPLYMAPEQHRGAAADPRSDQYAFGVALFEILVGRRPFAGKGAELLAAKQEGLHLHDTRLPEWLQAVIARGTAWEAADRFAHIDELVAALERGAQRRRAPWIASAVVATGGLAISLLVGNQDRRCDVDAEMAGIWNASRRDELETAMLATGASFAPSTFARVAERLDTYETAWAAAHRDACLASAGQGPQPAKTLDARMACLTDRRHQLRAVVDVLIAADTAVVSDAVRIVSSLPSVERCSDEAYVLARVKPPGDPEAAARADAIAARMAETDALRNAGRYDDALAIAAAAVDDARALGHTPTIAHALENLGAVLGRVLDPDTLAVNEEAYFLALASGDDELASTIATDLVYHLAQDLGRPDEALEWARHAEGLYARLPSPPSRAHLENNTGVALLAKGDLAGARPYFERSTQEERRADNDVGLAYSLGNLAALASMEDDPGAEALLREALAELERVLGPDHPDVAGAWNNLAIFAMNHGRHDDAAEYLQRALVVERAALGPDSPHVATTLHNIGLVLIDKDDAAGAQAQFRQAVAIRERTLGADHPSLALPLSGLGDALLLGRRPTEAVQVLERALRLSEAVPPSAIDAANLRWTLGRARIEAGDAVTGRALQEAACEMFAAEGVVADRTGQCPPPGAAR